jgi:hypothetical protein
MKVCLEINSKSKVVYVHISSAECRKNCNMKAANMPFENVANSRYFIMTAIHEYCIQEFRGRFNSVNAYYHQFSIPYLPVLLLQN